MISASLRTIKKISWILLIFLHAWGTLSALLCLYNFSSLRALWQPIEYAPFFNVCISCTMAPLLSMSRVIESIAKNAMSQYTYTELCLFLFSNSTYIWI